MKVFISYSSKTRDTVEQLAQDLEAMGNTIWFDRELVGGHKWWTEILEQIRACDLFVFTLTPPSLDSYPCKLEYTYANALKKHVLPILLVDITIKMLPAALQELQIVDYRQRSTAQILSLSKALSNLPEVIPLPDPLPTEPETPLPPFSRLKDRIGVPALTGDEQTLLLFDLKEFLDDSPSREEATILLDQFLARSDLLARVEKELKNLRSDVQPAKPVRRRLTPSTPPIFQHPDSVISVAFSPDGDYIATGGLDTHARLWEIETRAELFKFPHKHAVYAVAFSPDGNALLTGSEDRSASIWDTTTGELAQHLNGHTSTVLSAVFSPDGRYALTGSADRTARLWDAHTGETLQIFTGHTQGIKQVLWSPSSASPIVFTGSTDRTVRSWNIDSGQELSTFSFHRLTGNTVNAEQRGSEFDNYEVAQVSCIAISPDTRFVVVSDGHALLRLDRLDPNLLGSAFWGRTYAIRSAAFSPDGRFLLTGSKDTTARLWDASNGEPIQTFNGHTGTVLGAAYSSDGRYALTGSTDRTARLWDLMTK